MSKITHVMVGEECTHCDKNGRVAGEYHKQYGEMKDCSVCGGSKILAKTITLKEFTKLFRSDTFGFFVREL